MRVLADNHHGDLFYSLYLLFERRLGWELYYPGGIDWYRKGYWKVFPAEGTARQYLCPAKNQVMKGSRKGIKVSEVDPGISLFPDVLRPGVLYRTITFDAFKDMQFDIVLSSMPAHVPPFNELIRKYQPKAKHVFQAGNNWKYDLDVKNVLTSARQLKIPSGANWVYYHQEFDVDLFKPDRTAIDKSLVVNLQHMMNEPALFHGLESLLPKLTFKAHGIGNRDGDANTDIPGMAKLFQRMGILYHVKSADEGYGYNIHYAYATGTPLIVNCSYQKGFTAELLYEDGVNCIDVAGRAPADIAQRIVKLLDNYDMYSENVYKKFKQVVDFNAEFHQIQTFLRRLR